LTEELEAPTGWRGAVAAEASGGVVVVVVVGWG
jgi:hypothetical protein